MAKKDKPQKDEKKQGRIRQMATVYSMTKETDPKIGLILGGVFAVTAVVAAVLLFFLLGGGIVFPIITGVLFGVLAALIVFGRRAQKSQYAQIEGRPGAAAAALNQLRRGWKVDAAISVNRNQDLVHRVVGPPGIVLVGEGNPNRLASLLAAEKKRVSRVAYEVPIYDIQVGELPNQIDIKKLQKRIMKLPRNLKGPAIADLNFRLKALPQQLQMPKGPVPRGGRQPKMPRPRAR